MPVLSINNTHIQLLLWKRGRRPIYAKSRDPENTERAELKIIWTNRKNRKNRKNDCVCVCFFNRHSRREVIFFSYYGTLLLQHHHHHAVKRTWSNFIEHRIHCCGFLFRLRDEKRSKKDRKMKKNKASRENKNTTDRGVWSYIGRPGGQDVLCFYSWTYHIIIICEKFPEEKPFRDLTAFPYTVSCRNDGSFEKYT